MCVHDPSLKVPFVFPSTASDGSVKTVLEFACFPSAMFTVGLSTQENLDFTESDGFSFIIGMVTDSNDDAVLSTLGAVLIG